MAYYVTSDWHFDHSNICGQNSFEPETRGHFATIDHMNDTIINNINHNTKTDDVIYHFGDIGLGRPNRLLELVNRIHCKIVFIRGNHDNSKLIKKLIQNGYEVHDVGYRHKQDGKIYLFTHYPLGIGDKRVNIRNLCGHIHGETSYGWNVLNIGIDSPEIKSLGLKFGQPVPLDDAIRLVDEKWENNMKDTLTEEEWIRYGGSK